MKDIRKPNTRPHFMPNASVKEEPDGVDEENDEEELDFGPDDLLPVEEENRLNNGLDCDDGSDVAVLDDEEEDELIVEKLKGDQVPDSFLMPYKEMRKTQPKITICRRIEDDHLRNLLVPPSNCLQTLHDRFSYIQSNLSKVQVNPVFGCGSWARAFCDDTNTMKRRKTSAFVRLGTCYAYKYSPQYLAAMKLKKKSVKQTTTLPYYSKFNVDDEEVFNVFNKGQWFDRDIPLTKEELDHEIDNYMAQRAKENGTCPGSTALSSDVPKNNIKSISKTKFALMMLKIKQWQVKCPGKAEETKSVLKEYLNTELDEYKRNSKKTLDSEIDDYMAKGVKLKELRLNSEYKKENDDIPTESVNNELTNDDSDQGSNIEDMEIVYDGI